ncbi:hypothetical protein [Euzebya sp.]
MSTLPNGSIGPVGLVIDRLHTAGSKVKPTRYGRTMAQCPAHDDK